MELKKTEQRPTEGQFLAFWEFNGVPWCETMKIEDGTIYYYCALSNEWEFFYEKAGGEVGVSYFVPVKREKFEVYDANGKYYRSTNSKEDAVKSAFSIKGTVLRFVEDGQVQP